MIEKNAILKIYQQLFLKQDAIGFTANRVLFVV